MPTAFHTAMPALACACLLAAALAGCEGESAPPSPSPSSSPSPTASTAPAAPAASTAPEAAPLRTLGTFTNRFGFRQLYLLVPAGLSDAQLVALAERVHAQEKDAWLWLLDSDTQASALLTALPRIEKGQPNDFPKPWFDAHTRAYSVLEFLPQGAGRRWALYRGPYGSQDLLATLPCRGGAKGC